MLFRNPTNRRWRSTHAQIIVPQIRLRGDPEFIFNPNGSQILSLPGVRRPRSPSRVEVPCRPRMRHDPSLVDFESPPPLVDDEEDESKPPEVQRKNPCCLCKVGFYHGAMNFAIMSSGLHFFLMFYCIYIALFTEDYTLGFLKFWEIDRHGNETKDEEMQHLFSEIHVTTIVGSVAELLGLFLGVALIIGIVKEKTIWLQIWCVLSSIVTAIEVFGVAFLATRLSFMILIPIPFAIMIQVFGLWVIIIYVRTLGDPRKCPVCHHVIQEHHPDPSDHSLPADMISRYTSSASTKPHKSTVATQKSSAMTVIGVTFDEEDERLRSWRN